MDLGTAYLDTAAQAVELLAAPEVQAGWTEPSALAELTVGGLAGHLAYQILSVGPVLASAASEQPPIPLLEHYTRAAWIGAPLDGEANSGIRAKGEAIGEDGVEALLERTRAALAAQQAGLRRLDGDHPVFLPPTGWTLRLDDFLVTRLLELAVHLDDLAVSVGRTAPEVPAAAFDPVLALLTQLAVRRHGQTALLRALARAERSPGAIAAL